MLRPEYQDNYRHCGGLETCKMLGLWEPSGHPGNHDTVSGLKEVTLQRGDNISSHESHGKIKGVGQVPPTATELPVYFPSQLSSFPEKFVLTVPTFLFSASRRSTQTFSLGGPNGHFLWASDLLCLQNLTLLTASSFWKLSTCPILSILSLLSSHCPTIP